MSNQPTRIYVVEDTEAENGAAEVLVRAVNAFTAKRHVMRPAMERYTARVATQSDLERLIGEGARVQESVAEPEQRGI